MTGGRSSPPSSGPREPGRGAAVFLGGSAGGIEALAELLTRLPRDLPVPVLVTLHVAKAGTSLLPTILDRLGPLHAVTADDGAALAGATVYVAPRDRHMLVEDGCVRLDAGPAEHGLRPAIDPMFRSAARQYGRRAIGVVLSGMLDDGAAGLSEIHAHGGWTLVQDPDEASFPAMPRNAMAQVAADHVLPIDGIAERIAELASSGRDAPGGDARAAAEQIRARRLGVDPEPPGMRTEIACPTCGAVLWEEVEDRRTVYRCGAGHVASAGGLLATQGAGLDTDAWRQIRTLQERGALLRRLADRSGTRGRARSARYFRDQSQEALDRAAELRASVWGRGTERGTDEPNAGGGGETTVGERA